MKPIILLLLLAATFAAQDAQYDKSRDVTTVYGAPLRIKAIKNSGVGVKLSVFLIYPGERRKDGTGEAFIRIEAFGSDWLKSRQMIVFADGETFDLGSGQLNGKTDSSVGVSAGAMVVWPVPMNAFEKMARAETVKIKLGPYEGKLSKRHKEQIQKVLAYK